MQLAIQQAQQVKTEVPVGAVLVVDQHVFKAHNLVETDYDPTAHAEILVIKQACRTLKTTRLMNAELYVTLEPCAMCAQAIAFARIKTLYFGAYDLKGGGVEHGAQVFKQATCHHKPTVFGGIQETACGQLLKDFFKGKR